ncbi:hypothetical protein FTV88_1146 [Heliorestis convoluta]|uniref:Uncharacterized protein n=1 Tax=Heliorestis convoluta TaxID=356322 RepID=A0A5Q2N0K5_9FIRM|nr:hypothetical protein FTV88_1146 [Heliorestis convoluta]
MVAKTLGIAKKVTTPSYQDFQISKKQPIAPNRHLPVPQKNSLVYSP